MVNAEEKLARKDDEIQDLKVEIEKLRVAHKVKLADRAAETEAKNAQLRATIKELEAESNEKVPMPLHKRVQQAYDTLTKARLALLNLSFSSLSYMLPFSGTR